MALKVAIQESKNVAAWKDYKDAETGEVLAKFKINGANHQAYLVGLERAQNQIASKGYDVASATGDDRRNTLRCVNYDERYYENDHDFF